jgi:toxin FitB
MFLLDTNVISELRRPEYANPRVLAWAKVEDPRYWFLSVMTVLEIEQGTLLMLRKDRLRGEALNRWLHAVVLGTFAERILTATLEVARACAPLHLPNRRGERDAWIAATALVHDLTVVTRNTRDFEGTGVRLLNPWEG